MVNCDKTEPMISGQTAWVHSPGLPLGQVSQLLNYFMSLFLHL